MLAFIVYSKSTKTNEYFALKVINKEKCKVASQKKYFVTEKKLLQMVDHEYIISLKKQFETQQYLFLVLEYCPGRDLSVYLDEEGCFSESKAKFYILE